MKISCDHYDDFIENIKGNALYGNLVYASRVFEILDEYSRVCNVIMQLSCVLCYADGAQSLLQCGFVCGRDRPGEENFEGSEAFQSYKEKLKRFCEERGFSLKPGTLDI